MNVIALRVTASDLVTFTMGPVYRADGANSIIESPFYFLVALHLVNDSSNLKMTIRKYKIVTVFEWFLNERCTVFGLINLINAKRVQVFSVFY